MNDLDLVLIEPNGTVHRPLVLPTLTPKDCDGNAANGVQFGTCVGIDPVTQNNLGPAAEGLDRRNNVEQVVVQKDSGLAPGCWKVRVSVLNPDGTVRLPLGGTQTYSLAGVKRTACTCPLTQGYWKNHPQSWVLTLTLGCQTYSQAELLALLKSSTTKDASLILALQLIAANLNLANGSDPTPIAATIATANALLCTIAGKLPYNVKPSSATGQSLVSLATTLDSYNNGLLTPGCKP